MLEELFHLDNLVDKDRDVKENKSGVLSLVCVQLTAVDGPARPTSRNRDGVVRIINA